MRVLVGVGGGIAAYKAAELVRALQSRGADVQVILTRAAREFIQPLTFAALSGRKVITDLFAPPEGDALSSAVEHIAVAQENDVLVVAPATADLLAKFACGLADDFLTTSYLAFQGAVVLAPAMNTNMWTHAATRKNLETLRARGCHILDPDAGPLACGTIGPGRLPDPEAIANFVAELPRTSQSKRDLEGDTLLVTAGPTEEPIDPVRFISNRSSGKMGYAIAQAAQRRGARVILVSGPVRLNPPADVELIPVRTAGEMRQAVMARLAEATIVIKAAAVADYYVSEPSRQKRKKTATRLSLELDPTPDILSELGHRQRDYLLVGFAAETENIIEEARRKLVAKNCDMIVGNLVGREDSGFEADANEIDIVMSTGQVIHFGPAEKRQVAEVILDQLAGLRLALHAATTA
jgi:phosphopantothenoylcysteine decarboxylase/phosphopantothenate--cysteine ligase